MSEEVPEELRHDWVLCAQGCCCECSYCFMRHKGSLKTAHDGPCDARSSKGDEKMVKMATIVVRREVRVSVRLPVGERTRKELEREAHRLGCRRLTDSPQAVPEASVECLGGAVESYEETELPDPVEVPERTIEEIHEKTFGKREPSPLESIAVAAAKMSDLERDLREAASSTGYMPKAPPDDPKRDRLRWNEVTWVDQEVLKEALLGGVTSAKQQAAEISDSMEKTRQAVRPSAGTAELEKRLRVVITLHGRINLGDVLRIAKSLHCDDSEALMAIQRLESPSLQRFYVDRSTFIPAIVGTGLVVQELLRKGRDWAANVEVVWATSGANALKLTGDVEPDVGERHQAALDTVLQKCAVIHSNRAVAGNLLAEELRLLTGEIERLRALNGMLERERDDERARRNYWKALDDARACRERFPHDKLLNEQAEASIRAEEKALALRGIQA